MKHITTIAKGARTLMLVLSLMAICFPLFIALPVSAELQDYTPLAPIPGTTKGDCDTRPDVVESDPNCETTLRDYLPGIYKSAIQIAGILAVLVITYAGIEYMMSEAVTSKEVAKKRIWNAVGGLILAFMAYIILFTLNPDLVKNLTLVVPDSPDIDTYEVNQQGANRPTAPIMILRSPKTDQCLRTDGMTLAARVTDNGFRCSNNENSNKIVNDSNVCCVWVDGITPP